jgi:hypothetical protein
VDRKEPEGPILIDDYHDDENKKIVSELYQL